MSSARKSCPEVVLNVIEVISKSLRSKAPTIEYSWSSLTYNVSSLMDTSSGPLEDQILILIALPEVKLRVNEVLSSLIAFSNNVFSSAYNSEMSTSISAVNSSLEFALSILVMSMFSL